MVKNKVDIILPVYNSKKYILTTINSIIKQNYKYWNLIIVDDCSDDGTYEILAKLKKKYSNNKKIFLYRNSKNKGQAFARNLALNKTRSKSADKRTISECFATSGSSSYESCRQGICE
jgi:glycosyltransferase involved in cell wall biosynthesis